LTDISEDGPTSSFKSEKYVKQAILIFDHEDGGSISLENVGKLLSYYMCGFRTLLLQNLGDKGYQRSSGTA
jgi:hypothetical protein